MESNYIGEEMISSSRHKQVIYGCSSDTILTKPDSPEPGWLTIKCNGACEECAFIDCFINSKFQELTKQADERTNN